MVSTSVKYIQDNFEEHDRLAVVLIDRTKGFVEQKLLTVPEIVRDGFQAYLHTANASGRDVYLSMNTLRPEARGRTKADIDQIRHVYLDIDQGGGEALDRVLETPGLPEPHHVLNTSPDKFQIVWRVDGFVKEEAEKLLRNMAAAYGGDRAATDCSRVLRVPGFRNCKYDSPHYVTEAYSSQLPRYSPPDFPAYPEPEGLPVRIAPPPGEHRGKGSGGSQSEKDYAYVCRALERGERPSDLIAKVARFRADKSNPQYYAERTVERALQAHIRKAWTPPPESSETDSEDRVPSR